MTSIAISFTLIIILNEVFAKPDLVGDLLGSDLLDTTGDLINGLPIVGDLVENTGSLVGSIPVVGDLVERLPILSKNKDGTTDIAAGIGSVIRFCVGFLTGRSSLASSIAVLLSLTVLRLPILSIIPGLPQIILNAVLGVGLNLGELLNLNQLLESLNLSALLSEITDQVKQILHDVFEGLMGKGDKGVEGAIQSVINYTSSNVEVGEVMEQIGDILPELPVKPPVFCDIIGQ